jgi:TonB family protein
MTPTTTRLRRYVPEEIESGGWSRPQWWVAFAILFFSQIYILTRFTDKLETQGRPSGRGAVAVWVTEPAAQQALTELHWVASPLLFAGEPDGAFSQAAARQLPRTQYQLMEWKHPPSWINDPQGQWLASPPMPSIPPRSFQLNLGALVQDVPALALPRRLTNHWKLDPTLDARGLLISEPPTARPDPSIQRPTALNVLIDPRGIVLSVRLHQSSGNAQADTIALEAAKRLQFNPAASGHENPEWGTVQCVWSTFPHPATTPQPTEVR